jgi:serpin B
VLHLPLDQERLHAAFNYLALELAIRAEPVSSAQYLPKETDAEGRKDSGFHLNIVNAAWPNYGFDMRSEYVDVLDRYYGSVPYPVDYGDYPNARRIINGWIADQTAQRIDNLIPRDEMLAGAVLVLTNAVYFKAAWVNHFD